MKSNIITPPLEPNYLITKYLEFIKEFQENVVLPNGANYCNNQIRFDGLTGNTKYNGTHLEFCFYPSSNEYSLLLHSEYFTFEESEKQLKYAIQKIFNDQFGLNEKYHKDHLQYGNTVWCQVEIIKTKKLKQFFFNECRKILYEINSFNLENIPVGPINILHPLSDLRSLIINTWESRKQIFNTTTWDEKKQSEEEYLNTWGILETFYNLFYKRLYELSCNHIVINFFEGLIVGLYWYLEYHNKNPKTYILQNKIYLFDAMYCSNIKNRGKYNFDAPAIIIGFEPGEKEVVLFVGHGIGKNNIFSEIELVDQFSDKCNEDEIITKLAYKYIEVFTNNNFIPEGSMNDNTKDKTNIVATIKDIFEHSSNIILEGPPGTSKTHTAIETIIDLIGAKDKESLKKHQFSNNKDTGRWDIVQFHPSYSYEDFVQGIKAVPSKSGSQIEFKETNKIFAEMCKQAGKIKKNRGKKENWYYLIIDEINRGDLSKIFGELIYGLEYRNELIKTTYGELEVPENLKIIGTMNTADRRIAMVDYALRRRFAFVKMTPQVDILKGFYDKEINNPSLKEEASRLFNKVTDLFNDKNKDYQIGHTYFMAKSRDELEFKINYQVIPILEEYKKEDIIKINVLPELKVNLI